MSNNNPETQNSPATGGLPLRGLAMVLIAVAVLLGLWALYSLTQDGEDPTQTAESTNSSPADTSDGAPAEPGASDPGAPADNPESPAPADPDAPVSSDDAVEQDRAERDRAGEDGAAVASSGAAAPAGPGSGEEAAAAVPAKLNVLNNSTVPELAASVSEKLGEEGYQLGEVGNFSDEIFPETTVFFQRGNSEAEAEARELASRLGGVAREHVDSLPDGTDGADDLTLVLVKEVNL